MARDMLYDRLFRHAMRTPEAFDQWEWHMRDIPVFDISDVRHSLESGGMTLNSMRTLTEHVPKKPPFSTFWMEYTDDRVVVRRDGSEVNANITNGFLVNDHEQHHTPQVDDDLVYTSQRYILMSFERWNSRDVPGSTPINQPFQRGVYYVIGMNEDWIKCSTVCGHLEPASAIFPGLPFQCDPDSSNKPLGTLEYAYCLLAWAMMNCRNIVTEEIHQDKLQPKVRGEREHRPYCSYKVLKLEVPRRMAERNGDVAEGDDDGPKQRFHLCRGHFKNLQHPRFKTKGWHWWPAHWRGSIELGRADKSYALTPAQ